jgi:hypothetical protein
VEDAAAHKDSCSKEKRNYEAGKKKVYHVNSQLAGTRQPAESDSDNIRSPPLNRIMVHQAETKGRYAI